MVGEWLSLRFEAFKIKHQIKITTMDIKEKIKSYEDACKELGLDPKNLPIVDLLPEKDQKSIIAYYKLIIIIRALNEGWEADFANHDQRKYWVYLWVSPTGSRIAVSYYSPSPATAYFGVRLCFKTRELAEFAIKNFKPLYEEYLLTDY